MRLISREDQARDPATRTIAKKIIKAAQTAERDPEQICRRAIEELGISHAA
jgi:hypothetical protein